MSLQRAETIVLIAVGLLLTGITVADSALLAPAAARERADRRAIGRYVRAHTHETPFLVIVHGGRPFDQGCANPGARARVRLCVLLDPRGTGDPRVVGGWREPVTSNGRPAARSGCFGRARYRRIPVCPIE